LSNIAELTSYATDKVNHLIVFEPAVETYIFVPSVLRHTHCVQVEPDDIEFVNVAVVILKGVDKVYCLIVFAEPEAIYNSVQSGDKNIPAAKLSQIFTLHKEVQAVVISKAVDNGY